MDSYALYTYTYCPVEAVQGDFFISQDIKVDMSTEDKNLWLDRLFGKRNADVRIQHMKKRGAGADNSKRCAWSKQLTKKDAQKITPAEVFSLNTEWNPTK